MITTSSPPMPGHRPYALINELLYFQIVILFAAAMLVISCHGNESAQFHLYRLCLLECWKKFNKCTTECQGGNGDAGFERCERKFTKCEAKCQKKFSLKKGSE